MAGHEAAMPRRGARVLPLLLVALLGACLFTRAGAQDFTGLKLSDGLTGYRKVFAWGSNRYGELGINHAEKQASQPKFDGSACEPQLVMAIDFSALEQIGANLQRIVSGQNHVVAITEEGALYVWGRNDMGQLGLGVRNAEDTTLRFVPTLLELYNGNGQKQPVIDVALGLEHTVAVVKGGRVFVWGSNRWGQLGIDQDPDVVPWTSIPTPIDIGGESIRNVSSAGGHNAALTFGGAVYTWGANNEGQLGQSGCIREDGIGNDPCLNYVKKPTKIFKTNENRFMPQMKLIAVGGHFAGEAADGSLVLDGGHTLAVTNDNVLYGWGDNFHGQIGSRQEYAKLADYTDVYTPNKYDNYTRKYYNRHVAPVRVGPLVITTSMPPPPPPPPNPPSPPQSASIFAPPPPAPAAVAGNPVIIEIKTGSYHSLALTDDGNLFSWGDNFFGQLGHGYLSLQQEPDAFYQTQNYRVPEMIDVPERVKHWDYGTTEVVTETVGNVTREVTRNVQVTGKIRLPDGGEDRIIQVDAGFFQSIALTKNGNVYVWGTNAKGQMGTCGCGPCVHDYDAAGQCDPLVGAPPLPPAPVAITFGAATPVVTNQETSNTTADPYANYFWNVGCECNCAGQGTCKYTPRVTGTQSVDAVNEGKCVGFGENTKCECGAPYLEMTGFIHKMDQPMHFVKSTENFRFVSVAAGGAMFAMSQSTCPANEVGTECSGIGTCNDPEDATLATCDCPFGTSGLACEFACPVGTAEDLALILENHNSAKFPDSVYEESVDGAIVGELCSGHGTCATGSAGCLCDEFWFGERCQHMCPWDNLKRPCSGNGTCVYSPEIEVSPYCECNRWHTKIMIDDGSGFEVLDEELNEINAAECAENFLAIQEPSGWCSYHDKDLGFELCYRSGLCGVCEDGAARVSVLAGILFSIALVLFELF